MKVFLLNVLKLQHHSFQRIEKMVPFGCRAHVAIHRIILAIDEAYETIKGEGPIPPRGEGPQPEFDF